MREESRRRYRSSSRDRDSHRRDKSHKSYKKSKKSKKSKKYSRRSSSSSSSSSYESRDRDYHHSRRSNTRGPSSESNSRASKTRPPSSENSRAAISSTVPTKEIDLTDVQIQNALSTIEEDSFEAKTFYSTRDREAPPKKLANDKVIIDLKSETVQLPKPMEQLEITKEQIFHANFMGDQELKMEKWIRKLYNFRCKHFED